jgi:hypothetical protein
MRTRLFPLVVALTCALALLGASCAGDDEESGATTSTTEAVPDTEPTTTMSEEVFTAEVADIRTQLDAAGDDACPIVTTFTMAGGELASRTDPAAVEQLVKLYADVLRSLADTRQVAAAGTADATRRAADQLVAEAEAAQYSVEALQASTTLQSPEFVEAFSSIQQIVTECNVVPESDPTATTVP